MRGKSANLVVKPSVLMWHGVVNAASFVNPVLQITKGWDVLRITKSYKQKIKTVCCSLLQRRDLLQKILPEPAQRARTEVLVYRLY